MTAALAWVRANVVRVYAFVVAVFALAAAYGVDVPEEAWLGVVAALLALTGGEAVQRVENRKTEAAAGGGAEREGP